MTLTLFDGVTLVAEMALTSATSGFAIWDTSTFDSGRWGPDQVWTDVSSYVRGFNTTRAFSADLKAWTSGTFTLHLDNMDGRFSPDNLSGPYVASGLSSIIPGVAVRLRLLYAGVYYPIFYGYAKSWAENWEYHEGARQGDAYMICQGNDEWARIARLKASPLGAPVGASDTFGQRLHRILDFCGSTVPRDIDVGRNTMQAVDFSNDPATEIQLTIDSEGGACYVGADGTVIGRDQYALVEDTRSINSQVTFGDAGGSEIPWSDIDIAPLDDQNVINYALYTAVGGTPQLFTDTASRALYGDCYDLSSNAANLICETDTQALNLATWAVMVNAAPESRINGLTVRPRCNPTVNVPLFLGLQIRDLVTVKVRPPSNYAHVVSRPCLISGITHDVAGGDWSITYSFSSASAYTKYARSLWDTGLWGASDTDPNGARFFI